MHVHCSLREEAGLGLYSVYLSPWCAGLGTCHTSCIPATLSLSDQNLTMQGKAMTGNLRAMHAESVAAFAKMQALKYNPLELSQQAFVADYAAYQIAMNSIERRLANILKMVCSWAVIYLLLQCCP